MTISINWSSKIIDSTASITDLVVFHQTLRDIEDDPAGMVNPVTHTWKAVDLGGGAYFYALDLINGYQLRFPAAGNYTITGNLNGAVVPVAGVYVERKTSAAFVTTSVGGGGPSAADIAAAVAQRTIEGALTQEQILRILLSAIAGKTDGIGTSTEHYLAQDGATPRVTATFDGQGNRATVALNGA